MAKSKKPAKKNKKPTDEEFKKIKQDWYNSLPESEINPNGKEDFERVLQKIFPPIKEKK